MKITKFIPLAMLSVVLLASCQSRESKINNGGRYFYINDGLNTSCSRIDDNPGSASSCL